MQTNKTILVAIVAAICAIDDDVQAQSVDYRTPQWLQAARAMQAMQSTDRLIVKFKPDSAKAQPSGAVRAQTLAASAGTALRHVRSVDDRVEIMALPSMMNNDETQRIAAQIAANANVEYAEPDYKMYPALTPNDPGFSPGINFGTLASPKFITQWYLSDPTGGINAPAAWDITLGRATTVAVIDTGVLNHPDLSGRILQGYDFIGADPDGSFQTANDGDGRDNDARDPGNWISAQEAGHGNFSGCTRAVPSDWHGIHVAGIIAANTNNAQRIAGINWFANILPIRALGKCGGYTSDIIDGIRWASGIPLAPPVPPNANPAQIINLSLGIATTTTPPACSHSLQDAINDVVARGVTVVVASGNSAIDSVNSMPANCAGVISVGATLKDGRVASCYSNVGPLVTLSAPGGYVGDPTIPSSCDPSVPDFGQFGILSLNDGGVQGPQLDGLTASIGGTSFSTAIVSGVASLLLDVNPSLTPSQIKAILQSTSRLPSNPVDKGLHCVIDVGRPCYLRVADAAAAVNQAALPILSVLDGGGNNVSLLDFGSQTTGGSSAPKQLIVKNTSSIATLKIVTIRIAGKDPNDFNATTTCADGISLGPNGECTIDVTFTSKANNVRAADVVIAGETVDIPVALTGSGSVTTGGGAGGGGGGGGGGGCALGTRQPVDPMLWLLLVASVAYLARRRIAPR